MFFMFFSRTFAKFSSFCTISATNPLKNFRIFKRSSQLFTLKSSLTLKYSSALSPLSLSFPPTISRIILASPLICSCLTRACSFLRATILFSIIITDCIHSWRFCIASCSKVTAFVWRLKSKVSKESAFWWITSTCSFKFLNSCASSFLLALAFSLARWITEGW